MSAAQWEQGREGQMRSKNLGLGELHRLQSPVGCCEDSNVYFALNGYHWPMLSCMA